PPARGARRGRDGAPDPRLRRGGLWGRRRPGRGPRQEAPAPGPWRPDPRRHPPAAGGEPRRPPLPGEQGGRRRAGGGSRDGAHPARVEEVARMLAGSEVTPTSLSHARELLAGAARKPVAVKAPARRSRAS